MEEQSKINADCAQSFVSTGSRAYLGQLGRSGSKLPIEDSLIRRGELYVFAQKG